MFVLVLARADLGIWKDVRVTDQGCVGLRREVSKYKTGVDWRAGRAIPSYPTNWFQGGHIMPHHVVFS